MVIVLDTKLNSCLKVFNCEFSPWFSRILRKTWIPKSTDNPINKTAKATDIKLREPTVKDVIPVVINSPTKIDKIKQNGNPNDGIEFKINNYKKVLLNHWEYLPKIFLSSSVKHIGRDNILQYIEKTNKQLLKNKL